MIREINSEHIIAPKLFIDITQLALTEGMAAKEYYEAEKVAITTTEVGSQQASNFMEEKYWYDKLEQYRKNSATAAI